MLCIVKDSAILIRENDLRHREDVSQTNSLSAQARSTHFRFGAGHYWTHYWLHQDASQRLYFGDGARNLQSVNDGQ